MAANIAKLRATVLRPPWLTGRPPWNILDAFCSFSIAR
jgi:hypothetical protein